MADSGQLSTAVIAAWLADFAQQVSENAAWLTDLDRQIGDADHGSNMDRGMKAVAALDPASFDSAAALLKKAGMTLVSTVGGASGPLYGTLLMRMAGAMPPDGEISAQQWADALDAGLQGVLQRGKAAVGDKTMVDALTPAVAAFVESNQGGGNGADGWRAAASACAQGRDATIPLVARKGRASYLGERSADHQDPGASSLTLLLEAAARTLS